MRIFNEDCVTGADRIPENSVDLMICDPPFGINESTFDKHYKRSKEFVLDGYRESPKDYYKFSVDWLAQAYRVMKPSATMYLFSGWTNLKDILNAVDEVDFHTINHLIWKFNFGVFTKRKYVSSHYHILFLKKSASADHKFNLNCRFGSQEKEFGGNSSLAADLEDVFEFNKQYMPGEIKNKNKLPDALIEKLICYSSDEGDVVCDFFLGNFTTANVARCLRREPCGFEVNPAGFGHFMANLLEIEPGSCIKDLREVDNVVPKKQGKPLSQGDRDQVWSRYQELIAGKMTIKSATAILCEEFGRGPFSIKNILDRCKDERRQTIAAPAND